MWPLDDPRAAARVLIDLLEDEARLTRMSAAARARFERSFDATVIGPLLEQFLQSTPSAGGAVPRRRLRRAPRGGGRDAIGRIER